MRGAEEKNYLMSNDLCIASTIFFWHTTRSKRLYHQNFEPQGGNGPPNMECQQPSHMGPRQMNGLQTCLLCLSLVSFLTLFESQGSMLGPTSMSESKACLQPAANMLATKLSKSCVSCITIIKFLKWIQHDIAQVCKSSEVGQHKYPPQN